MNYSFLPEEFGENTGFAIAYSIVCLLNARPNNKYSCFIWTIAII